MKSAITYLVVFALFVFFGTAVHNMNVRDQQLDLKSIELQDTGAKIKTLETRYEDLNLQLNKELEHKEKNSEKIKKLEEDRKKLEQEKIELQQQLQAKAAERQKLAAGRVAAASAVPADKEALLAAAGVPQDQWSAAMWLINKESSWNSHAINPSSGACGLVQALPCSKLPCSLDDAVCQIKWQIGYVNDRYGGYNGAVAFHQANNWY
jgi:TolA-binding protein